MVFACDGTDRQGQGHRSKCPRASLAWLWWSTTIHGVALASRVVTTRLLKADKQESHTHSQPVRPYNMQYSMTAGKRQSISVFFHVAWKFSIPSHFNSSSSKMKNAKHDIWQSLSFFPRIFKKKPGSIQFLFKKKGGNRDK